MSMTTVDRTQETVLPPSDPSLIKDIETFLAAHGHARIIAPDGTSTAIPDEVYGVLQLVAQAMSRGSAVTVAPVSMKLTTSQAADILGVSRPTLVRLLEDGAIPYEQPRRHRLLRLDDVLSYKQSRGDHRREILAEVTRQAVADGLYDDDTFDMYVDALDEARHTEAGHAREP